MTDPSIVKYWESRGFSTAQRGWPPISPDVLAVFSDRWKAWHRGYSAYHKSVFKRQAANRFADIANRYHWRAMQAMNNR